MISSNDIHFTMILHVRSVVPEKIILIFTEIVPLKEVKCIGGANKII